VKRKTCFHHHSLGVEVRKNQRRRSIKKKEERGKLPSYFQREREKEVAIHPLFEEKRIRGIKRRGEGISSPEKRGAISLAKR